MRSLAKLTGTRNFVVRSLLTTNHNSLDRENDTIRVVEEWSGFQCMPASPRGCRELLRRLENERNCCCCTGCCCGTACCSGGGGGSASATLLFSVVLCSCAPRITGMPTQQNRVVELTMFWFCCSEEPLCSNDTASKRSRSGFQLVSGLRGWFCSVLAAKPTLRESVF